MLALVASMSLIKCGKKIFYLFSFNNLKKFFCIIVSKLPKSNLGTKVV